MKLNDIPNKFQPLTQAQLDAHWMPFSANREFKKDPRLLVEAQGCYYTDATVAGSSTAFPASGRAGWVTGVRRSSPP